MQELPPPNGHRALVRVRSLRQALDALRVAELQLLAFQSDNLRLSRQNAELRTRLDKTLSLDSASAAFEGGLGGRTAIEQYRNVNVGRFLEHMNTAGDLAMARGSEVASFFLSTAVLADLEALYAAPPVTEEEGRRRALCEFRLSSPGYLRSLSGTEEWNEKARRDFMVDVLRSGVDTTTQELLRRSGEMPPQKRAVPDGDDE